MLLAIDIGNTNIEFGVFEGETLLRSARLGTNRDATSDEIGIFIRQFLLLHGIDHQKVEVSHRLGGAPDHVFHEQRHPQIPQ